MSLAEKQARTGALQAELLSLRAQSEAALAEAHRANMEAKVDAQNDILQAQVDAERARLESLQGDGSVDDAKAAMEAAAASEQTETVSTDENKDESAPAESDPAEETESEVVAPPALDIPAVPTAGEEK